MGDITSFVRNKEFMVCVDSDGTAMNSVRLRQEKIFCPQFIDTFGLAMHASDVTQTWMQVHLHSKWRGANRYVALGVVLRLLQKRGFAPDGTAEILAWVEHAPVLTVAALENSAKKSGEALKTLLLWSKLCNKAITAAAREVRPFDGVASCLPYIKPVANVVVLGASSATVLSTTWSRAKLTHCIDLILAQETGATKLETLARLKAKGYDGPHVLFVGDTLGDAAAARANGILFYPILPNSEAEAWRRLQEEALPKFFHGNYLGSYQTSLYADQSAILR